MTAHVSRFHVARAARFDLPAKQVWALVGDFDDVSWMPDVEQVEILVPGQVRKVYLTGSEQSVTEALVSCTPTSQTFRFDDPGALPVQDYLAQIRVHEEGATSVVTWTAEFTALGASDEAAAAQLASWFEACLAKAGGALLPPLSMHVYVSGYKPIASPITAWDSARQATWPASTATLIAGRRDAVLVDALITVDEAARLIDWIRGTGKRLTTVCVTHGHADHFLGLSAVLAAFPGAQAVALPQVVPFTDDQLTAATLAYWETLFPDQLPKAPVGPAAMAGDHLELEGHRLVPVDVGQSDTHPSSVVWVRDLDAVIGGDVVYNGIHPWLAQTDVEQRGAWGAALDAVEELHPAWVISGHRDPSAPSDHAPELIAATRRYLRDFDDALVGSATAAELVTAMSTAYPTLGNPYTLTASAAAQLPAT
jgi:glyoxylase-like metal-dependent hydrolase (beta-lactamase superfamily II)